MEHRYIDECFSIREQPYHNYQVLTPAQQEENEQRWREYWNDVADRKAAYTKAAYTKARKVVNRAQKKARRLNRK